MTLLDQQRLFDAARKVILRAEPDVLAVYAYGSIVRGDSRSDSDLDIGIVLPPGRKLDNFLALLADMQEAVGRDADIVDLRRSGNVLRKEILAEGELLYSADAALTLAWEAEALSEYAAHRLEIRDILKQFAADGIGYAR
jgi:predicted nucleotidyltransferase